MAPDARTERTALRLTTQEAQVLNDVAAETGLSVSDIIRQAIRATYADRFKAARSKRRKR